MKQLHYFAFLRNLKIFLPALLLVLLNPIVTQNQINQAFMIFSDSCPAGYTDVSNLHQYKYTTNFYVVSAAGLVPNCNAGDTEMNFSIFECGEYCMPSAYRTCATKSASIPFYPYRISEPACVAGSTPPPCPISSSGYNFTDVSVANVSGNQIYFNGSFTYVSCRHCYERVKLCQWNP